MGTGNGLTGGTSVVDTNTRVYRTDNLFVVDASTFPGQVSTNPSAYIVIAGERAVAKILALLTPAAVQRTEQKEISTSFLGLVATTHKVTEVMGALSPE